MATETSNFNSQVTQSVVPTPTTPSVLNSTFGHPLSTILTVKLDDKNYSLWRSMVMVVLKGQKVDRFVLGTKPKPSEFIIYADEAGSSEMTPNPAFEEWAVVDQALLGWLHGSMSPSIACDVMDFNTAREIWKALEDLYEASSKARINQLRNVMQNTKKGHLRMKQTSENLKLAGEPITLNYLMSCVLSGLEAEYLPMVCSVEGRENITWQELYSILLTFENKLVRLNS